MNQKLGQTFSDRIWKDSLCEMLVEAREDAEWAEGDTNNLRKINVHSGKKLSWYSFRHTYITMRLKAGTPVAVVAANTNTRFRSTSKIIASTIEQMRTLDYLERKDDEGSTHRVVLGRHITAQPLGDGSECHTWATNAVWMCWCIWNKSNGRFKNIPCVVTSPTSASAVLIRDAVDLVWMLRSETSTLPGELLRDSL